jgi:hypothetical protein
MIVMPDSIRHPLVFQSVKKKVDPGSGAGMTGCYSSAPR